MQTPAASFNYLENTFERFSSSCRVNKQRKNPCWRRLSNCVQKAFCRLSPSGRNEKTPLASNSSRSVSYHRFGWAFQSSAKSWVDEGRPIAFKTRFFDFPHRGETKKHPRDRIQRGRFHTTILGGLFRAAQKSRVYEGSPIALKRRFFDFPHRGGTTKHPWDRNLGGRIHTTIWVGFSTKHKSPGWRLSSNCVLNAFFRLSPSGRNEKRPLGSNSARSVSYHHFGWAF